MEYIKILVDEFNKIINCNLNTKISDLKNDTIANYAPTYTVPRGKLGSNFIKSEIYLR